MMMMMIVHRGSPMMIIDDHWWWCVRTYVRQYIYCPFIWLSSTFDSAGTHRLLNHRQSTVISTTAFLAFSATKRYSGKWITYLTVTFQLYFASSSGTNAHICFCLIEHSLPVNSLNYCVILRHFPTVLRFVIRHCKPGRLTVFYQTIYIGPLGRCQAHGREVQWYSPL